MSATPLTITIQNPQAGLFFIVAVLVTAAIISLMLWRDAKRTKPTVKRCRQCGGRVGVTQTGAVIHVGDAHLVARQLPHVADIPKAGVL